MAPICPGYCCLPLPQAVTPQTGHIKQKCGPFYSLVDVENGRIQHFCNIFTLLSRKYHIVGACFQFENPACDVTAPLSSLPTEEGKAETFFPSAPAASGGLQINTKCMEMIIYYVNE